MIVPATTGSSETFTVPSIDTDMRIGGTTTNHTHDQCRQQSRSQRGVLFLFVDVIIIDFDPITIALRYIRILGMNDRALNRAFDKDSMKIVSSLHPNDTK